MESKNCIWCFLRVFIQLLFTPERTFKTWYISKTKTREYEVSSDVKYVSIQHAFCEDSVLAPGLRIGRSRILVLDLEQIFFFRVASRFGEGALSETCCLPSSGQRGQREIASVSCAEVSHMWGQSLVLCWVFSWRNCHSMWQPCFPETVTGMGWTWKQGDDAFPCTRARSQRSRTPLGPALRGLGGFPGSWDLCAFLCLPS